MAHRLLRSSLAALAVCTVGCSAWHRRAVPAPAPAPAPEAPAFAGRVRVTRTDGRRVLFTAVRVAGDSLVGDPRGPGRRAAVALGDIRRVDERRPSPQRTRGLLIGVGLAVVGYAVLMKYALDHLDIDFPLDIR